MTENKCKRKWINLQEICKEDTDSLKELLREVLQEVLEQEMTETFKGRERAADLGPVRVPLGVLQPLFGDSGGQAGASDTSGPAGTVFNGAF